MTILKLRDYNNNTAVLSLKCVSKATGREVDSVFDGIGWILGQMYLEGRNGDVVAEDIESIIENVSRLETYESGLNQCFFRNKADFDQYEVTVTLL